MFALEEHHWWCRALRQRIISAIDAWGAWPAAGSRERGGDHGAAARDPHLRCLDAGCGSGMLLTAMGDRFLSVGLDFSAEALRLARRRALSRLVRASIVTLPVRSESLDIILSADVLYHRGVPDDLAALREAARCLRPGGLLVVNLPAFAWLRSTHDEAIHTARRYTAREVRTKLARAGLRPLQVGYWNTLLFPPLVMLRLLRRWTAGRRDGSPGTPDTGIDAPGARSDLRPLPRWLNQSLAGLLALEARLCGTRARFGLSVFAVARKEVRC
ncbi:MAG: class I SAM-dependent methyltransferase [Candidatus Eisenbacteria sp.]|nr:class I SAM-dependent methyltransferase [Candidatus Eisenbacteria bacterium]